jgi:uncharacterized protein DUF5655
LTRAPPAGRARRGRGYRDEVDGDDDRAAERTPEQFFDGYPEGLQVYEAVERAIRSIGDAAVRVTKSQIAFRRRKGFAFVWRPGQYVASTVPAVLSIALPHESRSERFKEVVHPSAAVWMHHIELGAPEEVDAEVRRWLATAYDNAA